MTSPHLTRSSRPRTPRGVVLMLHGGAERNVEPVTSHSLAWQRSRVMRSQIGGELRDAGLAVWLLRYRYKGWNHRHGAHPLPVGDARWALDRVRETYAGLPVVLLGHSMGARTAAAVADDPAVVGVVGLAPWFPPGEPVGALAGRRLVAAHGRADRITSFDATADFVERSRRAAVSAELVDMGPLGHYMVRGARRWNSVAVEQTVAMVDA